MQWATSDRRGASERLTPEPCQVHPSWKAPPPAGTSTGTKLGLDAVDGGGLAQFGVRDPSGPWNSSIIPQRRLHRCEPRTYSTVPWDAVVSSRAIQQLTHSEGTAHCS